MTIKARHIRHADVPSLAGKVIDDGGDLRLLSGSDHGVPPDPWHVFRNTGNAPLLQTAIHGNRRAVTEFEDGTRRD